MAVHECFINKSEYFWNFVSFRLCRTLYDFPDVHQLQTNRSDNFSRDGVIHFSFLYLIHCITDVKTNVSEGEQR